jgi:copper chaperone CopZ
MLDPRCTRSSLSDLAGAEILSADLQVNGLTCPFCAFGIEKKLLDVDGVTSVDVRLDEGLLQLQLAPKNSATTAALEAAVEKAGFQLAGLALEVRRTLTVEETRTWLEVNRSQRFLLVEAEGVDGERPLSPAMRERLRPDDQGQVVVSGRVRGAGEGSRLVVDLSRTAARRAP